MLYSEVVHVSRMVSVTEAKAQLSRLLDEVQNGERVVIGNAGKPVAVLSAYNQDPAPRRLGAWAGQVWMSDDFDAPLEPELQKYFDGDNEADLL